jgi:hypothetical protein
VAVAGRERPSVAERDRVAEVLRRACVDERLSAETFVARLDLVYAARTRMELDRLVADLPEPTRFRRALLRVVGSLSALALEIRDAWSLPRLPRLVLPATSRGLVIGRAWGCDLTLDDPTVSARHAALTVVGGRCVLRDNGSRNGTFVNGWRVVDEIVVRPGDVVRFGGSTFVLAAP